MAESYLGVNFVEKFIDRNKLKTVFERLAQLNMSWIRLEFDFNEFFASKNDFSSFQKICRLAEKNHINVLGLVNIKVPGNLSNLLDPKRKYPYVLDHQKRYAEFLKLIVNKFKDHIKYWEIWNEQNTRRFWINEPSPKDYSNFLVISKNIIKKYQKEAKIVYGGILGDDKNKLVIGHRPGFYKESLEYLDEKDFDYANFHPYIRECYVTLKTKQKLLKKFKDKFMEIIKYSHSLRNKHIFFTEFGISRKYNRLAPKDIADIYFELYDLCRQHKVVLFLWTLAGPYGKDYSRFNPETSFDLLDKDMEPTELFVQLSRRIKNKK